MKQLDWSRIVGVLTIIGQLLNVALGYFGAMLPHDAVIIIAGVLGFIQAVTGRVQGTQLK